jgi:hypothetical protein
MASSERKRQEKLARKAAKRKQHHETLRRAEAGAGKGISTAGQIALVERHGDLAELSETLRGFEDPDHALLAGDAPFHSCLMPADLFERGIGTVVVSRKLPDDRIVAAVFLLDVWSLGVKDAFVKVASAAQYPALLRLLSGNQRLNPIEPACARKLVEEAEAYAADLGFRPHPNFAASRQIFGDLDAGTCRTQYRFGKNGKPYYVSGPNESEAQSKRIVDTLTRRCGPGGFHYIVAMNSPEETDAWIAGEEIDEEEVIEGEVVEADDGDEEHGTEAPSTEEGEPPAGSSWLKRLSFRR